MIEIDLSEPIEITHFGKNIQKGQWQHSGRVLDDHLAVFVTDGSACFSFAEKSFLIESGSYVIVPAKNRYEVHTDSFCEYYFFHFLSGVVESENEVINLQAPVNYLKIPMFAFALPRIEKRTVFLNINGKFNIEIASILKKCGQLSFNLSGTNRILFDIEITKILVILSEISMRKKNQYPQIMEDMIAYIQKNYTKKITLSDIAKQFSVSESYAARIFKKNLNVTAGEYIMALKLDYASQLLLSSNMSVREISEYLSFYDEFYFSKKFKQRYKKTPKQYRMFSFSK